MAEKCHEIGDTIKKTREDRGEGLHFVPEGGTCAKLRLQLKARTGGGKVEVRSGLVQTGRPSNRIKGSR